MSLFKITKSQIEAYVNNGLTVKAMAEDITAKSGTKCSPAVVRNACKTYGVDLRRKKRSLGFVFDDLELSNGTGSIVIVTEPGYVHSGFVPQVVEEAVVTL